MPHEPSHRRRLFLPYLFFFKGPPRHTHAHTLTRTQVDILVHSLANGPEVTRPLLETSRAGYLAASSASAYSMVAMVRATQTAFTEP
jgi:hypothetical protein